MNIGVFTTIQPVRKICIAIPDAKAVHHLMYSEHVKKEQKEGNLQKRYKEGVKMLQEAYQVRYQSM